MGLASFKKYYTAKPSRFIRARLNHPLLKGAFVYLPCLELGGNRTRNAVDNVPLDIPGSGTSWQNQAGINGIRCGVSGTRYLNLDPCADRINYDQGTYWLFGFYRAHDTSTAGFIESGQGFTGAEVIGVRRISSELRARYRQGGSNYDITLIANLGFWVGKSFSVAVGWDSSSVYGSQMGEPWTALAHSGAPSTNHSDFRIALDGQGLGTVPNITVFAAAAYNRLLSNSELNALSGNV